jgi:hypothetical protein
LSQAFRNRRTDQIHPQVRYFRLILKPATKYTIAAAPNSVGDSPRTSPSLRSCGLSLSIAVQIVVERMGSQRQPPPSQEQICRRKVSRPEPFDHRLDAGVARRRRWPGWLSQHLLTSNSERTSPGRYVLVRLWKLDDQARQRGWAYSACQCPHTMTATTPSPRNGKRDIGPPGSAENVTRTADGWPGALSTGRATNRTRREDQRAPIGGLMAGMGCETAASARQRC